MGENVDTMGRTGQYLSFCLDAEVFAIEVARIREIIDRTTMTRIPRMPAFVSGVINLRGSVVPVVDLRMKFDMGEVERTVDTCIVVLEVCVDRETTVVGALVDSVKEVFELEPESIEPPPKMGTRLDSAFIEGMGRLDDGFVIILDVDRVFSADDIEVVHAAAQVPDQARHRRKRQKAQAEEPPEASP